MEGPYIIDEADTCEAFLFNLYPTWLHYPPQSIPLKLLENETDARDQSADVYLYYFNIKQGRATNNRCIRDDFVARQQNSLSVSSFSP